jgi:uncharacterized membrane protein
MSPLHRFAEIAAQAVEALAVALMVFMIAAGTLRWLAHSRAQIAAAYAHYRRVLAKALLVGLELLVAADIIRSIINATLADTALLGALVVVRTFLSWSITVEVENRWPWQEPRRTSLPEDPSNSQDFSAL